MSHTIEDTRTHLIMVESLRRENKQLYGHIEEMAERNAELKAELVILQHRLNKLTEGLTT